MRYSPLRKMQCLLFFLAVSALLFSNNVIAQNSNKGTDFWIGFMSHIEGVGGPRGAIMSIYITSDVSTSGTISIPGINSTQTFSVTANSVTTIDVPAAAYIDNSQGVINRGIHVVSKDPIVVYAHIYAFVISGSTLVLPTNTLGRKYIVSSYQPNGSEGGSFSQFLVIGTEDATTVRITPRSTTTNGNPGGVSFDIVLNAGEVYEVQSKGDLSGSMVESISSGSTTETCKRIAVFGGTTWSPLGCPQADTGDNLFQQMYPINSWGREFITMPFKTRSGDFFRVYAAENNTVVSMNGNATTLNAGGYFETNIIDRPQHITANNPISVVQYSITQICDGNLGDPEMIILNPIEQNLKRITMNSTLNYQISRNYVNVLIKTNAKDSFRLNGRTARSSFTAIPGTIYSYLQEEIPAGSFTLTADSGFNAIVYGFGDIESYGYSAGSNLEDVDKRIIVRSQNVEVDGACIGVPLNFDVQLPYKPTKLVWNFANGTVTTLDNPNTTSTQQPYIYHYVDAANNDQIIYRQPGVYIIRVTATRPGEQGCEAIDELMFTLNVEALPDLRALPIPDVCERDGNLNLITMLSARPGTNFTFTGNGVTDSTFNPLQAGPGTHTINLSYSSPNAICSKFLTFSINVKQSPIANAGDDVTIDLGESAQLLGTVSSDVTSFSWTPTATLSNPAILNPIATPTENTDYILAGVGSNGCPCKDTVTVKVLTDLKIPNVFSPNGDNINDTWVIDGIINYPNAIVEIFNRWGDRMFYSQGYGVPWDGMQNGKAIPQATYYYVIRPNNPRLQPVSGAVTVVY